jgi:hypothetical protein
MRQKMALHMDRANRLQFDVDYKAGDASDQLAFIVLVGLRFGGEITEACSVLAAPGVRRAWVVLRFPDFLSCDDARVHCGAHLADDGRVKPDYRGALDRADPGRGQSADLLARIKASRSN